MKELTVYDINQVSGASLRSMFDGAVTGAVSMALSSGKWGGLSILNLGIGQAVGVIAGIIVGGVGGALYGMTHTSQEAENFFNNLTHNVG